MKYLKDKIYIIGKYNIDYLILDVIDMYVIIMGMGRVGLSLANLLIDDGYDITLIDDNEALCNEAAAELDALVICGNGTNSKLLEEANIEDADFFIATTGNDEANLLSCILVRKYDVPNIIARVSNPDHEEAFIAVGIDNVISPEITAAGFLEKLVTRPNVADLISLGEGDAEILDMTIGNDKLVGKRIKEVSPTKDFIIIATYPNGKLVIPQEDNILVRGEKVSVLVKRGSFSKVSKNGVSILNSDDLYFKEFKKSCKSKIITYGKNDELLKGHLHLPLNNFHLY